LTEEKQPDHPEEGVEVPYEQINPDTLRTMIQEFVTRDWSDFGDDSYTMEGKIAQVLQQLRDKKVKVVFDLKSQTANIVVRR